ncbi:uncharacterized protein LOC116199584 [Punica granatum]|uniref:Uncharacterized protein LOC116199584 n=2 Tax=Punica granatum TaxID=22663 RepID=A0A6P8CQ79_PUNGR|nr:uncharacterized protein LOC116199584 [Punica granatum]PKI32785.1 hypothetical protein CRG98_046833 [Punica granatum]
MDWFSWLSKTGLDPSVVYEYGLSFTHNELEQEDICHFTHEFLQSMGISIAKHRLEIIKLARKENKEIMMKPPPISRLLSAIKTTRSCLTKYMRAMSLCEDSTLAIVPRPRSYSSGRLRGAVLRKHQKLGMAHNGKQRRLLLTNGSETPMAVSAPRLQSFSSPLVYAIGEEEKVGAESDRYWSAMGVEEMRWDSMFQDLKPT